MAERATITVRRQVLDVEVLGTESDGLALQRRLPGMCADVMSPALETAFVPIDPGGAHLYIERLAIDLSGISFDRLESELAEAVRREVADYFRRNPPLPSAVARAPMDGDVQWRTAAETVDEALVVFLRTGRLPWSFRVPSGSRLERLVLDTWGTANANRGPPPGMRARLLEVLAEPHARARLLMQFTPEFVMTVLDSVSPQLVAAIEEILAALDGIHPSAPAFNRRVLDAAFVAASAGSRLGPSELARAAWRRLAPIWRQDRTLAEVLERRWPGATNRRDAAPSRVEVETPQPMRSARSIDLVDETEEILVDNAGVVLLHPFLSRLFEGLGLAKADQLLDPGRVLCLLHHLATGEPTAPEHQLTVAKVLCGVPLDEPVEADVGLADVEMDEVTALLQAAIGHWEALRDTSPHALRGEFLMRPGALAVNGDGEWLLRVETRTVDILLDQLPWGISMVKLPWMRRLLRVEWR